MIIKSFILFSSKYLLSECWYLQHNWNFPCVSYCAQVCDIIYAVIIIFLQHKWNFLWESHCAQVCDIMYAVIIIFLQYKWNFLCMFYCATHESVTQFM